MRKPLAGCAIALVLGFSGIAFAAGDDSSGHGAAQEQQQHGAMQQGAAQAEDGINLTDLSSSQVMDVQRQLQQEGQYDGDIDGVAGNDTKQALRNFQQQNDLGQSGKLDQATAQRLGLDYDEIERQVVAGEDDPQAPQMQQHQGSGSPGAGTQQGAESPSAQDPEMRQQAPASPGGAGAQQGSTGALGQEQGSEQGAQLEGQQQQAPQAGSAQAAQPLQAESLELAELNSEHIRQLQSKLQEMGFYRGEVDGIVGPQTRNALSRYFQAQAQLVARGEISADSLNAFGVDASEVQPARGVDEEPAQDEPGLQQQDPLQQQQPSPQGTEPQGTDPYQSPQGSEPQGADPYQSPQGSEPHGADPYQSPQGADPYQQPLEGSPGTGQDM